MITRVLADNPKLSLMPWILSNIRCLYRYAITSTVGLSIQILLHGIHGRWYQFWVGSDGCHVRFWRASGIDKEQQGDPVWGSSFNVMRKLTAQILRIPSKAKGFHDRCSSNQCASLHVTVLLLFGGPNFSAKGQTRLSFFFPPEIGKTF